jgi:hypothetical protein
MNVVTTGCCERALEQLNTVRKSSRRVTADYADGLDEGSSMYHDWGTWVNWSFSQLQSQIHGSVCGATHAELVIAGHILDPLGPITFNQARFAKTADWLLEQFRCLTRVFLKCSSRPAVCFGLGPQR